jgi:hypothetical protein
MTMVGRSDAAAKSIAVTAAAHAAMITMTAQNDTKIRVKKLCKNRLFAAVRVRAVPLL